MDMRRGTLYVLVAVLLGVAWFTLLAILPSTRDLVSTDVGLPVPSPFVPLAAFIAVSALLGLAYRRILPTCAGPVRVLLASGWAVVLGAGLVPLAWQALLLRFDEPWWFPSYLALVVAALHAWVTVPAALAWVLTLRATMRHERAA